MNLLIPGLIILTNIYSISCIKSNKTIDEKYLHKLDDTKDWHIRSPTRNDVKTSVLLMFKKDRDKDVRIGLELVDDVTQSASYSNSLNWFFHTEDQPPTVVQFNIDENDSVSTIGNKLGKLSNRSISLKLSNTELTSEYGSILKKFPKETFHEYGDYYFVVFELNWEPNSRRIGVFIPREFVFHPYVPSPSTTTNSVITKTSFVHTNAFIVLIVALGILLLVIIGGLIYLCYLRLRYPHCEHVNNTESLTTYTPFSKVETKNTEVSETQQQSTATTNPQVSTTENRDVSTNQTNKDNTVVYSKKDSPTKYIIPRTPVGVEEAVGTPQRIATPVTARQPKADEKYHYSTAKETMTLVTPRQTVDTTQKSTERDKRTADKNTTQNETTNLATTDLTTRNDSKVNDDNTTK